jgi:hypothetical protein
VGSLPLLARVAVLSILKMAEGTTGLGLRQLLEAGKGRVQILPWNFQKDLALLDSHTELQDNTFVLFQATKNK